MTIVDFNDNGWDRGIPLVHIEFSTNHHRDIPTLLTSNWLIHISLILLH